MSRKIQLPIECTQIVGFPCRIDEYYPLHCEPREFTEILVPVYLTNKMDGEYFVSTAAAETSG